MRADTPRLRYQAAPIVVGRPRTAPQVSDLLRPTGPETDPLTHLIAELKAEARTSGLTDEDIDAELAAYNAERRL